LFITMKTISLIILLTFIPFNLGYGEVCSNVLAVKAAKDRADLLFEKQAECLAAAIIELLRYIHDSEFEALIMSGRSASKFLLPLLKKAWKTVYQTEPMPPIFMFKRPGTIPYIVLPGEAKVILTAEQVESLMSLARDSEEKSDKVLLDYRNEKVCFVDDFVQAGTKYGILRNGTFPGVNFTNVHFAFIVARAGLLEPGDFAGSIDEFTLSVVILAARSIIGDLANAEDFAAQLSVDEPSLERFTGA